jgi:hypothetical protein
MNLTYATPNRILCDAYIVIYEISKGPWKNNCVDFRPNIHLTVLKHELGSTFSRHGVEIPQHESPPFLLFGFNNSQLVLRIGLRQEYDDEKTCLCIDNLFFVYTCVKGGLFTFFRFFPIFLFSFSFQPSYFILFDTRRTSFKFQMIDHSLQVWVYRELWKTFYK